jgi:hypothetical protein
VYWQFMDAVWLILFLLFVISFWCIYIFKRPLKRLTFK